MIDTITNGLTLDKVRIVLESTKGPARDLSEKTFLTRENSTVRPEARFRVLEADA